MQTWMAIQWPLRSNDNRKLQLLYIDGLVQEKRNSSALVVFYFTIYMKIIKSSFWQNVCVDGFTNH